MTKSDSTFHITLPRAERALIDVITIWLIALIFVFCLYKVQEGLGHQLGIYLLFAPIVPIFFTLGLSLLFTEVTLTHEVLINHNRLTGSKKQIALKNIVKIVRCGSFRSRRMKTWRMTLSIRTRAGRLDHFAYHRDLDPYLFKVLENYKDGL